MGITKAAGAGEDNMIDPMDEVRYRYRLANEYLSRAEKYCSIGIGLDAYIIHS